MSERYGSMYDSSPTIFETSTDAMQEAERIVIQTPNAKFVIQWDDYDQHLVVFVESDATLCVRPVACNAVTLQVEPEEEDTYP